MQASANGVPALIASRAQRNADEGQPRRAFSGPTEPASAMREFRKLRGLVFSERGTHSLKGAPGEWHLYALTQ